MAGVHQQHPRREACRAWRRCGGSWTDRAAPVGSPVGSPVPGAEATPLPEASPVLLGSGALEDAEHRTSGPARVLELADGRRFVRLEGLVTSDGPDLHVWLSSATSGGGWGSYDDGRFLPLGELKATRGNHHYEIPVGADLRGIRSVVIWCDRFNVAFGSAPVSLG
ncbi:MAG: DM13 domain-containing protein [Nocardioides sp.]|nr:DM13 domain-containing protein [Nocardioides sp.]